VEWGTKNFLSEIGDVLWNLNVYISESGTVYIFTLDLATPFLLWLFFYFVNLFTLNGKIWQFGKESSGIKARPLVKGSSKDAPGSSCLCSSAHTVCRRCMSVQLVVWVHGYNGQQWQERWALVRYAAYTRQSESADHDHSSSNTHSTPSYPTYDQIRSDRFV